MSNNQTHIDDIFSRQPLPTTSELMDYVDGKLDRERSRAVEMAMVDDPGINATVEAIESVGTKAYREMLAELDQRVDQRLADLNAKRDIAPAREGKVIRFLRPKSYIAIAAAVVLLAVVGYFGAFHDASLQSIANDYYDPGSAVVVRGDNDQLGEYDRATKFYLEGNFAKAADLFRRLPDSDAKLMAGHAYFQLKDFKQATQLFSETVQMDQGNREDGEYFLALSYLQLNQEKEARGLLKTIARDDAHTYHQQALNLLGELGK